MCNNLQRAVIVTAVMLLSLAVRAHDIIVTTDARKIEAKITEVSKSEIRYKELDNPDGPMFVIATDEISSVIYSNGKVVLYNQPAASTTEVSAIKPEPEASMQEKAQPVTDESLADILLLSGQTIRAHIMALRGDQVVYSVEGNNATLAASQIEKVTFLHNGQVKVYNAVERPVEPKRVVTAVQTATKRDELPEIQQTGRIYRDNNHFLYNNTYISHKEVERILKRENSAAYRKWKQADGLLIGGSVCAGVGGGLVLGGLLSIMSGNPAAVIGLECSALVPLGIGLGLTFGSTANYNKAIDLYNSKFDRAAVELRWHASPAEVGVAIAF